MAGIGELVYAALGLFAGYLTIKINVMVSSTK